MRRKLSAVVYEEIRAVSFGSKSLEIALSLKYMESLENVTDHNWGQGWINLLATDFFFSNLSTSCILNVSNTETKQDSIMK